MPRFKALSALALLGVLISAGTVGSQDPLRARAEAESAESALPISAPDASDPNYNPYVAAEGRAVRAPRSITPYHTESTPPLPVSEPPATVQAAPPAPRPQASVPLTDTHTAQLAAESFALALTTNATQASNKTAVPTPTSGMAIAPAAHAVRTFLPEHLVTSELTAPAGESTFAIAQRRLFATVPDEIEPYFDLFMYVSKSNRGALAQRMYVFQRDADGRIIPYAEWPVSTGREKLELHKERKVRTITPEGIFALNPKRFHKRYWSTTWDGAPMHYAMFYDLMNNGRQSGLAIHAAIGADKVRKLGRRDSAGCVRLSPKNAKELFYKVKNATQGRVPVLALNDRGSTDRWGRVQRDDAGTMLLQDGYRALVFVENYDGRDELVSPVVAYTN
jgi:lipoprotein-anchoring transpeptidase ErfK/SrfK